MAKQQSITSLPRSPEEDRRARMIKYSITMGIRLLCIIACFVVPGYWIIIPAIGAVFLPYVAVVLANITNGRVATVQRPDQLALPVVSRPLPSENPTAKPDAGKTSENGPPS